MTDPLWKLVQDNLDDVWTPGETRSYLVLDKLVHDWFDVLH